MIQNPDGLEEKVFLEMLETLDKMLNSITTIENYFKSTTPFEGLTPEERLDWKTTTEKVKEFYDKKKKYQEKEFRRPSQAYPVYDYDYLYAEGVYASATAMTSCTFLLLIEIILVLL